MKLASVRDLKLQLTDRLRTTFAETRVLEPPKSSPRVSALRPMAALGSPAGRKGVRVRVASGAHTGGRSLFVSPRPVAAFGVGVSPRPKDFRLAVRVFRGHENRARALLTQLKIPSGELDVALGLTYLPRLRLRPGGSCGHYLITAGTLGGFARDDTGIFIVSNNHVLANSDDAWVGDPILQPGPIDIRQKFSVIGHLERWVPLRSRKATGCDAAIARISDDVDGVSAKSYPGFGRIVTRPLANRYAASEVVKVGRTTGLTRGKVSAYELDGVAINYGTDDDPMIVTFNDQLEFIGDPPETPFSQPGDSGSFIIDRDTRRPYALLYGGGPDADGIDRTLGQFMSDVLGALKVTLIE